MAKPIKRIAVPRLFLIDQSLSSLGGHHYDYVNCVAKSACDASVETIVGTNRNFSSKGLRQSESDSPLFRDAKVFTSFRNTTYQKVSWLAGLRHLKRARISDPEIKKGKAARFSPLSWLQSRRNGAFRKQRRKLIAQFACDCNRFFRTASTGEFRRGDQVFLTTVSELEMMGLAIFLSSAPSSKHATWHLQFHYNLFDGRPAEFDSQAAIQRKVRGCFLAAMSRIPDHDLRFYCTSEELADQYARLRVAEFTAMPYPINTGFAPAGVRHTQRKPEVNQPSVVRCESSGKTAIARSKPTEANLSVALHEGPARMIVPGELRREKGSAIHLQGIVDDLWEAYLSTGRLQVAVQRPRRRLLRGEKLELTRPGGIPFGSGDKTVDYLRHPLSERSYCEFIRGCDFGLLMHDSRAYYSRRAGVLGELMSCGKPVIVPAGCWLAHQLQEPLFQHVDSVRKKLELSRSLELREMKFGSANAPLSGGIVSFDRKRHPFRCSFHKDESENIFVISFKWQHPTKPGVNTRIHYTEHLDAEQLTSSVQVVGHRDGSECCLALFRSELESNRIELEFENAFDESTALIRDLKVELYCAEDRREVRLGYNGLICADKSSVKDAVIEIVDNLEHYQQNALEFSGPWWRSHDPNRTLDQLFESHVVRKVA